MEAFCYGFRNYSSKFWIQKVFKKDGTLSVDGNKAYGNLIEIIYNLQFIGVISNAGKIIDKLDKILDEN